MEGIAWTRVILVPSFRTRESAWERVSTKNRLYGIWYNAPTAPTSLSSWTMWNVIGSVRESRKDANLSSTAPCSFSGRFDRLTDLSS
jgi:hypothetical protein